ncbi:MAG: DUF5684 domain-containing protein [Lachnospiraceae bacterium]|nr:DUF5684 domain-containing protein [Lachnospiraceae bacterium]
MSASYTSELSDMLEELTRTTAVTSSGSGFINFAVFVMTIIALWMIYEKAGEHGWASIIPYYRQYVWFKVAGKANLFWAWLGASIASTVGIIMTFVGLLGMFTGGFFTGSMNDTMTGTLTIGVLLFGAGGIVGLIMVILRAVGLAKAFGQGGGFAVGLIFLQVIFLCILAFSKNMVYVGEDGGYTPYTPAGPGAGAGYGAGNPYGTGTPYGAQPQQFDVYGQPVQPQADPYGQPVQPQADPYGQQLTEPYGQPMQPQNVQYDAYGQPAYGQPTDPNAAGAAPTNPYFTPVSDAPKGPDYTDANNQ